MDTKKNSKTIMAILLVGIIFICYNAVLFLVAGVTGHGTAFWLSYIMMLIAFLVVGISVGQFKANHKNLRDWLLGLPVLKHSMIYLAAEFMISILFMIIDVLWGLAFGIQLVVLAIHLVFIISCFMAKETMDEVNKTIKINTSNMDRLTAESKRIALVSDDEEIRKILSELAEMIRFSDPVGNPETQEIEYELLNIMAETERSAIAGNKDEVAKIYKQASLLLEKRNTNCKLYKQNRF